MKGISNFITFIVCVGILVVGIIQPFILAKNDSLTIKLFISLDELYIYDCIKCVYEKNFKEMKWRKKQYEKIF